MIAKRHSTRDKYDISSMRVGDMRTYLYLTPWYRSEINAIRNSFRARKHWEERRYLFTDRGDALTVLRVL